MVWGKRLKTEGTLTLRAIRRPSAFDLCTSIENVSRDTTETAVEIVDAEK